MRKIMVSLLLFFISFCLAKEIRLFRLSDKVGDTIDFNEKEQYSLFPGIINFESARILVKNDTIYFAEINSRHGDTLSQFFLKLTPKEVERLTFCIENYDIIKTQIANDKYAELAFKRFWDQIESRRISTVDREIPSSTTEGRFIWTVRGTTIGSALGGAVGSWLGINSDYTINHAVLDDFMDWTLQPCVTYRTINHAVFWPAACLGTGLGAVGGYKLGERIDRNKPPTITSIKEGKEWRTRIMVTSVIPGLVLGCATFIFAGGFYYGKIGLFEEIENDPYGLTMIPGLITGFGVTIEIIHLGYRIGRSIDRKRAIRAAKKTKHSRE